MTTSTLPWPSTGSSREARSGSIFHPERPDVVFSGTNTCRKCQVEKPVSEFTLCISRGRNTVYLSCDCKKCRSVASHDWKVKNPSKAKRKRLRSRLRNRYGLELQDYERMLVSQGGACEVCKNPPKEGTRLHVDHDHLSGKVRALLCNGCNGALGKAQDDPDLLRNLALYIERFREVS